MMMAMVCMWLFGAVLCVRGAQSSMDDPKLIGWQGEVHTFGRPQNKAVWQLDGFGEEALQMREHLNTMNDKKPPSEPYGRYALYHDVLSEDECKGIITAAESYANFYGWTRHRHTHYPTTDIPTNKVPALYNFGDYITYTRLAPLVEQTFGLKRYRLSPSDLFVVKYNAVHGQQNDLKPHRDGSEFSYIIMLNDAYEGGGTYFVHNNVTIHQPTGSVLVFCGKNHHGAMPVTKGVRYLMAGFLRYGTRDD